MPLFGLLMLGLVMFMGISVDGSRGTRVSSLAGNALDAAALAAAKALRIDGLSDEALQALVEKFFQSNLTDVSAADAVLDTLTVSADRISNTVELRASLKVPTTVSAVFGQENLTVNVRSVAVFDAKDVEVSMMLDVSGSMDGSKINDLKAAAQDLVDILIPASNTEPRNRIAIAPFSTAVNAGTLTSAVAVGTDSRGRGFAGRGTTCVTERPGIHAFTDRSPTTVKLRQRSATCARTPVRPLTSNRADLAATIDDLRADGWTAGHLGIAWAWYLLSPQWSDILGDSAGKSYDDPEIQKVAILMTDGMFNNFYESGPGDSVTQARALCANMKAAGVAIYTVGFQVPEEVVPTLRYCATSPKHFFSAEDGSQLRETFRTIANRLNGLRIAS
jgi:Flp pilus assembly protein TadG